MKDIIKDRLNKIADLNERQILKKILLDVYENIVDYNMDMYDSLEKRIFEEIENPFDELYIYTSILNITELDPISSFFYAMKSDGVHENKNPYPLSDWINNQVLGYEVILTELYLECSYPIFREILGRQRKYKGSLKTEKADYEIFFTLKQNFSYIQEIERLYQIFQYNQTRWKTINCPFAYKFVDAVLLSPLDIDPNEEIIEMTLDLEEYDGYKFTDMVPVWNVKEIMLQDKSFPMPAIDRIHYEHRVKVSDYGNENGYMITFFNPDFEYIKRYRDNLVIVTAESKQQEWNILQIKQSDRIEKSNSKRVFSNKKKMNFAGRYASLKSLPILTKGEIARLLEMYPYQAEIQLLDVEICDQYFKMEQTMDYNSFIKDTIRGDDKKRMVLTFFPESTDETFLYDKLSFLVSEIQLLFPEFRCIGELLL